MSRLRQAQQIAAPADFQIVVGDAETGTRFGKFLDGLKSFHGVARQHRALGQQQIGAGLLIAPAHAAADLVELGQAEAVGAVDDDRIGRGNIQTRSDNRRADQHVEFAPDKLRHGLFDVRRFHLAVHHADFRLRDEPLHQMGDGIDGAHPVMDKKDLAAPRQFGLHGGLDGIFIEFQNIGFNRLPVFRAAC